MTGRRFPVLDRRRMAEQPMLGTHHRHELPEPLDRLRGGIPAQDVPVGMRNDRLGNGERRGVAELIGKRSRPGSALQDVGGDDLDVAGVGVAVVGIDGSEDDEEASSAA